jgi:hypothetical protein
VIGYRDTYPTVAERVRFASAFRGNLALRLFYGVPHDLASVAGYAEFRLVGLLSVVAVSLKNNAVVRALSAEEEAGRYGLMRAGGSAAGRWSQRCWRRSRSRRGALAGDRGRPARDRYRGR